jgi:hypothetical protein
LQQGRKWVKIPRAKIEIWEKRCTKIRFSFEFPQKLGRKKDVRARIRFIWLRTDIRGDMSYFIKNCS